ncbi:MAG: hypothetical protein KatS3mg108_0234 [Isosphaeraceae bacterium]|jgi:tetratricopeptide (TPR) repeat protein|nr:MAG: hypothetical protein KatS3mg108_0234 [Isosphaeraceae bacterium]
MPRHATSRQRPRRRPDASASTRRGLSRFTRAALILGTLLAIAALWAAAHWLPEPAANLRLRADAAAREGRWLDALQLWAQVNASPLADAFSWRAEARAALALGRAAHAERALDQACRLDPANPEPWLIRLERLRMLGRPFEAMALGQAAVRAVPPSARQPILRAWTLAILADPPDDLARATLARWIAADPNDLDALAALDRRYAEYPQASDPPRADRIARLQNALLQNPSHLPTREALAITLAETGQPQLGRSILNDWPPSQRNALYDRLDGRWALDYENNPAHAVDALRRALAALPTDRRSRYRLARALQATGLTDAARAEAQLLARLYETLEPVRLTQRLDNALADNPIPPHTARDLAHLCRSVGLDQLASLWDELAQQPHNPTSASSPQNPTTPTPPHASTPWLVPNPPMA